MFPAGGVTLLVRDAGAGGMGVSVGVKAEAEACPSAGSVLLPMRGIPLTLGASSVDIVAL